MHACMLLVLSHLVSNSFKVLISSCAVGFNFLLRAIDILGLEIMHICRVTLRLDFGLFYGLASFCCSQGCAPSFSLGTTSLLMGSLDGFALAVPGRAAFSTRRHCAVSHPFGVLKLGGI
jgi:hypothetical protein